MTSAITPGVTRGKWRIITQGSEHIWDLDKRTWLRVQHDGLNPMPEIDNRERPLDSIMRWPVVGGTFYVVSGERWHQSSTIRAILPVEEESP